MCTLNCEVCGKTFTARRSDAKTCSSTCRKRAERYNDVPQILQKALTQINKIGWVLSHNEAQSDEARLALQEVRHQIDEVLDRV